jgi:hypothetical protein
MYIESRLSHTDMTFPTNTEVYESGHSFRPRVLDILNSAPLTSIETVWHDDKTSVGNELIYKQILNITN